MVLLLHAYVSLKPNALQESIFTLVGPDYQSDCLLQCLFPLFSADSNCGIYCVQNTEDAGETL